MRTRTIFRALIFGAVFVLWSEAGHAQIWSARKMLDNTSAPRINLLTRKGSETIKVDTVERLWIERSIGITRQLSGAYELPEPLVFVAYSQDPNAYVTLDKQDRPYMVINTEMLRMAGNDPNLLATVIGHELGHIKGDHLTEGRTKQNVVHLIGLLAGLALDINQAKQGVDTQGLGMQLGDLGSGLVNAKFSRDQEREADDLGIRAMAKAGFDPGAVPMLWKRMEELGGSGNGLWLDSHPSPDERKKAMQTVVTTLAPTDNGRTTNTQLASIDIPKVVDEFPISLHRSVLPTQEEMQATVPGAYRLAWEARKREQNANPLKAFQELPNDDRALAILGDAYYFGRGASQDSVIALRYYEQSANLGFAPSIMMLAELTQRGLGRPADPVEAIRLLSIAHQRGVPRATGVMSLAYLTGRGVIRDTAKARQLSELAAQKNDPLGKAVFGAMLRDGVGGPADQVRGFYFLKVASKEGASIGYAHYQLALAYERGAGVAADKDLAIASYRKALANGASDAKDRLLALGEKD